VCKEIFSVAVDVSVALQSQSLLTMIGNISSNSVDVVLNDADKRTTQKTRTRVD